jgi:hypothetical protein
LTALSLGLDVSWEFLALTRPGVSLTDLGQETTDNLSDAQKQLLQAEGSSYGSAVSVTGRLGLHF